MATAYRSSLDKINGSAIVKSLTITQQPTKTVYMEGEPLDLTGLRASAVVEPFSGEVTSYVTTTPSNGQTVPTGISEISVRYGNAVVSIPITVYDIEEIEITTQPTTTEYLVGDTLDLTGIVVTGYANNGEISGNITSSCIFTPETLSTSGEQTITATYKKLTDTTSVNVYEYDTLTVTTKPTKRSYKPNDTLDLTGIVITQSASGSSISQNVTSQCTFSLADGTILDEEKIYTITVTYNGLSTSFDIVCSSSLPDWDSRGLNYNSWDTISKYTKECGLGIVASVGETKSFTVSGSTLNAEIVSINDGTGDAGQWYPNKTVDFISTRCYTSSTYNSGLNTNEGGFPGSSLKNYLNNSIYSSLSSDLKDIIIEKSHSYNIDGNGTMSTDATKIWLPTLYEIIGQNEIMGETVFSPGETAYNNKIYISNNVDKGNYWWTASIWTSEDPYYNGKGFYNIGPGNGGWVNAGFSGNYYYFPICFRIG